MQGRGLGRGKGKAKIVAARIGVHIQHLAREVKPGAQPAFHSFGVYLPCVHPAAGDDGVGKAALLFYLDRQGFQKRAQRPALGPRKLVHPFFRRHAPHGQHLPAHGGRQKAVQCMGSLPAGKGGKVAQHARFQLFGAEGRLQVDSDAVRVLFHIPDMGRGREHQRARYAEMREQHLALFAEYRLFALPQREGHVFQGKALHALCHIALLHQRHKAWLGRHHGVPCRFGKTVAVACGARRLVRHAARGHHHSPGAVFAPALAAHTAYALSAALLPEQKRLCAVVHNARASGKAQKCRKDIPRGIALREHAPPALHLQRHTHLVFKQGHYLRGRAGRQRRV